MVLQWKVDETMSECRDYLRWEPKQLYFSIDYFHQHQTMVVTRMKDGSKTILNPIINGGGYDKVPIYSYRLLFQ
ncbi:unnamed protein product [Rotaria sp. Silwood2]|nr:unnamed protein product [Rotaria sp. Silwood2]CAF4761917.1 unnamed protein product [Rotaria sp. Silwood2]